MKLVVVRPVAQRRAALSATAGSAAATVSRAMRHLTMVHGIVAFAFNTAVLALTINVGASLLS